MLKVLKFLRISTKGINFAAPKGGRGLACGFGRGAKKIALCLSHRAIPLKTKTQYMYSTMSCKDVGTLP